MPELVLWVGLALVVGCVLGIVATMLVGGRHRRFLLRWTLEVERDNELGT